MFPYYVLHHKGRVSCYNFIINSNVIHNAVHLYYYLRLTRILKPENRLMKYYLNLSLFHAYSFFEYNKFIIRIIQKQLHRIIFAVTDKIPSRLIQYKNIILWDLWLYTFVFRMRKNCHSSGKNLLLYHRRADKTDSNNYWKILLLLLTPYIQQLFVDFMKTCNWEER
jgi:hypothetical protein